jgi:hypothetical protein
LAPSLTPADIVQSDALSIDGVASNSDLLVDDDCEDLDIEVEDAASDDRCADDGLELRSRKVSSIACFMPAAAAETWPLTY